MDAGIRDRRACQKMLTGAKSFDAAERAPEPGGRHVLAQGVSPGWTSCGFATDARDSALGLPNRQSGRSRLNLEGGGCWLVAGEHGLNARASRQRFQESMQLSASCIEGLGFVFG